MIDPFGGGGAAIPTNVPPVGAPLYSTAAPIEPPSPEERAGAVAAADDAVGDLTLSRPRCANLAAAIGVARLAGPHALDELLAALDRRAGITSGETNEPPRAA